MYKNLGTKLKKLSQFFLVLGSIPAIICGIILMSTNLILGLVVIALGVLYSYFLTWGLYAFGEACERIERIEQKTNRIELFVKNENSKNKQMRSENAAHTWASTTKTSQIKTETTPAPQAPKSTTQQGEKTLCEKLAYALAFQSDDGMINYLKTINDEEVKKILEAPRYMIRDIVKQTVQNLKP